MDPALAYECGHRERVQRGLLAAQARGDSAVARCYSGATILVTGGSGFLGKQLIAKLFRSCNVSKVYVILRGKKEKNAEMRLKNILSDPIYDSLHTQKPNFVNSIILMEGDVGALRLGLSDDNWRTITEEVNVIFHLAASMNFNGDLVSSTLINVRGAREALALARECRQLRSFVHVSTAFAHATASRAWQTVEETFYESPVPPDHLVLLAENNRTKQLDQLFKSRGAQWPNVYTFTKAVGEEVVRTRGAGLPLCVVRPAIVTAAYRESPVGWVDPANVLGPSGLVLGCVIGVCHALLMNLRARMDIVPVDLVSNATLAAAYRTGALPRTDRPKIYAVTNSRSNFLYGDLIRVMNTRSRYLASPRTVWYLFGVVTDHDIAYRLLIGLLHYAPAIGLDTALLLTGQKPRFFKLCTKATQLSSALGYFTKKHWVFQDDNTISLYNSLSSTDKDLFNFDITSIDFDELVIVWYLGIRKYIIKDNLQGTEYALKKQFYLKIIHCIVSAIYLYVILKTFFCIAWILVTVFKWLS